MHSDTRAVKVDLGQDSYEIVVQHGLRQSLATHLQQWNSGQTWVVLTQQAILDHYTDVISNLREQGFKLEVIVVAGDESAKNISQAEKVWSAMVDAGCDRSSVLLAMGGGVVGDLGGFVAATYMRGIDFIQLPTTLLAMIDSAIGGKTAVNLPAGKNLVGAIYQPRAVLIDPEFLSTLPQRNVVSSLAEAIKYGLIKDSSIFESFEARFEDLLALSDQALLTDLIARSCAIKADIVSKDQYEHGERRLLNYGHTLGHAFETLHDYDGLYHGEAVLYGMQCANSISHQKGLLATDQYERAQALLKKFPLPRMNELDPERILEIVSHDKKFINGKLNFIVLNRIGDAVVSTEVSGDDIRQSLTVLAQD